jgi:hypothetical protein
MMLMSIRSTEPAGGWLSEGGIKFEDDELTAHLMDKGCVNNNGRL